MYTGGYMGKILRINLSNKTSKEEPVSEALVNNYLGGAGFAIKYLYDELKPGTPCSRYRQQAHLRGRSSDGYRRSLRQPHGRRRQVPAYRRDGYGPGRRAVPCGNEDGRL